MQKIKVIHADDHGILRYGIRHYLSDAEDIELVGEASNGEECIRLFEKLSPHVCLIDIEMPDKNGLEVVRLIRQKDSEVKLLIFSAHTDQQILVRAKEAGVNGYLPKGTPKQKIIETIRSIAAGNQVFSDEISTTVAASQPEAHLDDVLSNNITKRELEILELVVAGKSSPEIAEQLFISRRTVDTHRNNLMQKLDIHNTASLVRYALQHNLVSPAS